MKIKAPWKCDYCSAVKGEQNHWWMRNLVQQWTDIDAFILIRWCENEAGEEQHDGAPAFEHICGNVCADKALEKWLGAVSVDS